MSNPTSNFGWQMPTNSDLVTDLPADFEVFGQGVDTTLADLKGGTTGQILSKASNTDMDFTWTNLNPGDITGVTATSPLTGGGTSGDVTIGIQAASTSQSGAVQLTDSTSSTSTTTAATPNSVKSAYDKASTPGTTSTAGIVQLTDSTSSTSTTTAATPNSVKTSYDLANAANSAAVTNNFFAGKNKIINGDFGIWQRGTSGFSTSTSAVYCADRFFIGSDGATITATQQSFTPGNAISGYEIPFFMQLAITASGVLNAYLGQRIEDVRTFAGQTATISFWAKCSSGTISSQGLIAQNFGSGGSAQVVTSFSTSQTITTTWQRFSITINVPSISGKTIGSNSVLEVQFIRTPASGTIQIWGAQIEAGSVATPFQTATGTKQGELAACQRYYWRVSGDATSTYSSFGTGIYSTTTNLVAVINNPVPMRVTPTLIDYSNLAGYDGVTFLTASSFSIQTNTSNTKIVYMNAAVTGATQYRPAILTGNNSSSAYLGFSAEL